MRSARLALTAIILALAAFGEAAADDPNAPWYVVFSTTPMTRNADVLITAARLVNFGTDSLLDLVAPQAKVPREWKGVGLRAAKLVALDLPLTAYAFSFNHEYGHITRAREAGIRVKLTVLGTPWSARPFDAFGYGPFDLGTLGGGFEASAVMTQRVQERWQWDGQASVSDAIIVLLDGLHLPLYAQLVLSESALSGPQEFMAVKGDPSDYVFQWMLKRHGSFAFEDLKTAARSARHMSWLNVLDWTFVAAARGIAIDHIWHGKRSLPARWLSVGPLQIAPGLRYHLSPIGPERYARTHFKVAEALGSGYVRWTEPLRGARHVGAGAFFTVPRLVGLRPRLAIDVWRDNSGRSGGRGEIAGATVGWPSSRTMLTAAVGAKTRGYLLGFPTESGVYVSVGGALRFD